MIEVNKGAKPFHPCEEFLGTELLFLTKRCQLIGRNYYAPQHPTNKKDVMCQLRGPALGLSKILKGYGFYDKMTNMELAQFYQFVKEDGANLIQLYVAPNNWTYDEMARAAEMCKYLQFFTLPGVLLSKDIVIDLHQINTGNWGCRSDNGGTEVELFQLPPQQEDGPMDVPPAPHHWNPHPHVAAQMAQEDAPAGVMGAGQWYAQAGNAAAVAHAQPAPEAQAAAANGWGFINQILGG